MQDDYSPHEPGSDEVLPRSNVEDKIKNTLLRVLGVLDKDLKNISAKVKTDEGKLVIEIKKKTKDLETDLEKILHRNKKCKVVVNPSGSKSFLYEVPDEVKSELGGLHRYVTSNETGELHEININSALEDINKKLDELEVVGQGQGQK